MPTHNELTSAWVLFLPEICLPTMPKLDLHSKERAILHVAYL